MKPDLPPAALLPGEVRTLPATLPSMAEEAMVRSLIRLDSALSRVERPPRPIILRIGRGVTEHFKLRVAEWFATALLLQFGLILYGPDEVFPHSPNLSVMAQWASEQTWGLLCLGTGAIHLLALTINGTFRGFRWSPHIRATASFMACFLWFQITLAIFMSGVGGTGLGTYRLVLALEIWNVIRACVDIGAVERRHAAWRQVDAP